MLQRDHATVETGGVRTAKATGLRSLPSRAWQVSKGWVLAANIAAGLTAWARLLGLPAPRRELFSTGPVEKAVRNVGAGCGHGWG